MVLDKKLKLFTTNYVFARDPMAKPYNRLCMRALNERYMFLNPKKEDMLAGTIAKRWAIEIKLGEQLLWLLGDVIFKESPKNKDMLIPYGMVYKKWLVLIPIPVELAEDVVRKNHYSKTAPLKTVVALGVYKLINRNKNYLCGEEEGIITLGRGIRPNIKSSWGVDVDAENSLEIDRLWLSDNLPRNSESITLAATIKFLKIEMPKIKYLISYADDTVGNTGIIYKAANFKQLAPIKADFYILEDGTRVHPVTMWHWHGTREWSFLEKQYPNIKKAEGNQRRYIYDIYNRR